MKQVEQTNKQTNKQHERNKKTPKKEPKKKQKYSNKKKKNTTTTTKIGTHCTALHCTVDITIKKHKKNDENFISKKTKI